MKCPVCRARYRSLGVGNLGAEGREVSPPPPLLSPSPSLCRRCGVDLSPLIRLHDQAIWYYRRAIQALKAGDYSAAADWNQRALALNTSDADFHALAGRLWALQGEFRRAIACLKKAQQLDPKHPTARALLQCFSSQT